MSSQRERDSGVRRGAPHLKLPHLPVAPCADNRSRGRYSNLSFLTRCVATHSGVGPDVLSCFCALQWMSVLMLVMATFPKLVQAPSQMDILFTFPEEELKEEIAKLSPECRFVSNSEGLRPLVGGLTSNPDDLTGAVNACTQSPGCVSEAVELAALGVRTCFKHLELLRKY